MVHRWRYIYSDTLLDNQNYWPLKWERCQRPILGWGEVGGGRKKFEEISKANEKTNSFYNSFTQYEDMYLMFKQKERSAKSFSSPKAIKGASFKPLPKLNSYQLIKMDKIWNSREFKPLATGKTRYTNQSWIYSFILNWNKGSQICNLNSEQVCNSLGLSLRLSRGVIEEYEWGMELSTVS